MVIIIKISCGNAGRPEENFSVLKLLLLSHQADITKLPLIENQLTWIHFSFCIHFQEKSQKAWKWGIAKNLF